MSTNDPCTTCGKPVDSHTPLEASKCRENRQPSVIPKPTVEATLEKTDTLSDEVEKPNEEPQVNT